MAPGHGRPEFSAAPARHGRAGPQVGVCRGKAPLLEGGSRGMPGGPAGRRHRLTGGGAAGGLTCWLLRA